jgi:hypothetical protein
MIIKYIQGVDSNQYLIKRAALSRARRYRCLRMNDPGMCDSVSVPFVRFLKYVESLRDRLTDILGKTKMVFAGFPDDFKFTIQALIRDVTSNAIEAGTPIAVARVWSNLPSISFHASMTAPMPSNCPDVRSFRMS